MAIVYPGADYRQLRGKSTTLFSQLVINIHTMVGTLAGSESWFTPSGRPYSHFGVGGSGAVWQWQDLQFKAASDLNGNSFCISIETEDMGSHFPNWGGSNVPHFTDKQLDALVKLVSWLCTRFSIRRVLLTTSCQRDGVSYHRLGIDPYRAAGCTKYSNATGKVCPGDNKISDIKNKLMPRLGGQEEEDLKDDERTWLKAIHDDVVSNNGRMYEVTTKTRRIAEGGFFASREGTSTHVYWVFNDKSGRIKMLADNDPMRDWFAFTAPNAHAGNPTPMARSVIDGIPVVGESEASKKATAPPAEPDPN